MHFVSLPSKLTNMNQEVIEKKCGDKLKVEGYNHNLYLFGYNFKTQSKIYLSAALLQRNGNLNMQLLTNDSKSVYISMNTNPSAKLNYNKLYSYTKNIFKSTPSEGNDVLFYKGKNILYEGKKLKNLIYIESYNSPEGVLSTFFGPIKSNSKYPAYFKISFSGSLACNFIIEKV